MENNNINNNSISNTNIDNNNNNNNNNNIENNNNNNNNLENNNNNNNNNEDNERTTLTNSTSNITKKRNQSRSLSNSLSNLELPTSQRINQSPLRSSHLSSSAGGGGGGKPNKSRHEMNQQIATSGDVSKSKDHVRRVLFTKILENKGSVARDHLANERTFLAWLRTGLSCIALGVALAKIGTSRAGGIIFVALGSLFLLYSPIRYFQVYRQLLRGNFSPNRFGTVLFIILCLAAAITALVIVLANHSSSAINY
ncbi:hypothetical protein PPL_07052 [Heterostelium album PN500]|uniref:DUF202 domain-containing protein n=1 Tax=Heterostelium pallidum (strain ATCC 26659 / Pp 5 / PN500) TaxID=670386 RepID=D3BE96_HETP5|nr:hypothetical protein PPL_07052 [Heterostelium album PN500]EFA80227.1 hypothetical protein PPL_07052 [Heterostelium album PN500]|eukprot:XP_020432347.1 hypothetical protein PPL_07052 [Heterostelium album PN500]